MHVIRWFTLALAAAVVFSVPDASARDTDDNCEICYALCEYYDEECAKRNGTSTLCSCGTVDRRCSPGECTWVED